VKQRMRESLINGENDSMSVREKEERREIELEKRNEREKYRKEW
jgi:hypothetical protein